MASDSSQLALVVLIPVFDDYDALGIVMRSLEGALRERSRTATVLVVDDGSSILREMAWSPPQDVSLPIHLLRLRRNLGHQRAIAIGLAYIYRHLPCEAVVIMDSDGEDRPADVPRLIDEFERLGRRSVIFAERRRRSERLSFQTLYHLYRILHRTLTGIAVRFGNFSVVPFAALSNLVVASELWNHYAAAVLKTRQSYGTVHTNRGQRLAGRSSLNLVALVVHGLSAISVFGDVIGVRLAIASGAVLSVLLCFIIVLTLGVLVADVMVPMWALFTSAALLLVVCQVLVTSCMVVVFVLGGRANTAFIPLRDYEWFVHDCTALRIVEAKNEPYLVSRS
jgi:hypothetical protein